MARLILTAYGAEKWNGGISIAMCIAGDPPFPQRVVEIKRAVDAAAAFDAYKAEALATGKPMALSMRIAPGDRSPPGFKKLKEADRWPTVNL